MDYYASKDSQTRDTGYQSPSEVLLHIDNDLEAVIKSVASKITMIRVFRHQNDLFDVPDGNRIESPSLNQKPSRGNRTANTTQRCSAA